MIEHAIQENRQRQHQTKTFESLTKSPLSPATLSAKRSATAGFNNLFVCFALPGRRFSSANDSRTGSARNTILGFNGDAPVRRVDFYFRRHRAVSKK